MPYGRDKVIDVIRVLTIMKREFTGTFNRNITEMRKIAIHEVANAELSAGRFAYFKSAKNCIHDACTRRLKPDVQDINDFEKLADQWLRRKSMSLSDILSNHSDHSVREVVTKFFEDNLNGDITAVFENKLD